MIGNIVWVGLSCLVSVYRFDRNHITAIVLMGVVSRRIDESHVLLIDVSRLTLC